MTNSAVKGDSVHITQPQEVSYDEENPVDHHFLLCLLYYGSDDTRNRSDLSWERLHSTSERLS